MTRDEYFEKHHQLSQSIIGLVSIQTNFEGVREVLDTWKPKLTELSTSRYKTLCEEAGMEWEEFSRFINL